MQKILSGKNINIESEECFICFESGFFVKCKAIGTKDFIFTGQIFPVLDRLDFTFDRLYFFINKIFIFSDQFSRIDIFLQNAQDNQVIIIPDKDINFDKNLLQKTLESKKILIVYDVSFYVISQFLDGQNLYCGIYLSSKKQSLDINFIYKKFSFLQKINELNLNNSNIIQYTQKYKKYKIGLFRKKAIIIDLGANSMQIKDFFYDKYDIFMLSVHTDLEVIKDLNPNIVIFSDSFCNPNFAYKTISKLINFCINSNMDIYGFGFGFFIIAVAIGIKCKLVGFNYKDSYIFNDKKHIIKNDFLSYYCVENIKSKKITRKLHSADDNSVYGFVYKFNRKKIIGVNELNNLQYLL